MEQKTIYALSTVYGKSGVAVIRVSGTKAVDVFKYMTNIDTVYLKTRYVYYTDLKNIDKTQTLDKAVVIYFKAPHSFTGEDIVEIHTHGSKAVLSSVF